ncbi:MAG: hypothetical protein FJ405_11995 [Verrucomicrobia bacterium]|nr:hypothetical protein [Verrucomicrobiota bacterium]
MLALSPAFGISPSLASVSPPGAQAGTDVELTLAGARLDDAKEIIFYSPGIKVISLEPAKKGTSIKAMVRVSPDCARGEHQLRVRTLTGISELRTFAIGAFPVLKELEPNNEISKCQVLPVNTTVHGTITSEDQDIYKVQAVKGERLSAEVEAMRLGRVMFDPSLAILDPEGKPLVEVDDSSLGQQDPFVSVLAPKDGFYHVVVRDSTWGGGDGFVYRLHVGSFPRPSAVFPLGGSPGQTVKLKFLGDPAGPISQSLEIPKSAEGEWPAYCSVNGVSAPTPNRIRISSLPNIFESTSNNQRQSAVMSPEDPPAAFNGIISKPGESDWFGFTATKKVALEISVFARRLRSPLDPVLELADAKGKVLESNDDSAGMDSVLRHTPDDTGILYLRVRDQMGRGGPDFAYRIEVVSPKPSVTLSIPEVARNDTQTRQAIAVPRGNRMATMVSARRSQFNGELSFQIPGLPQGITFLSEVMPAGVDAMPWVFEAAADAGLSAELVEPQARSKSSGNPLASRWRHRVEMVRGNNDQVYYATHSDRLCVAAVQEIPYSLELEAPSIPLVRSGSMNLKVRANRKPGFDDPISVKMLWNPAGITSETEVTIPKGKSSALYGISSKSDAALGSWKLVVLGSANQEGGSAQGSSGFASVRVAEPFVTGKITTAITHPGQAVALKCSLDHKQSFEGTAKVRLTGLPEKASAREMEITSSDKEILFEITLDPKISTGSHKNLACVLEIRKGDDTILQTVGSGGILRIVPPKKDSGAGKKVAAASGVPPKP